MKLTNEQEAVLRSKYGVDKLSNYDLVVAMGIRIFHDNFNPHELVTSGVLEDIEPLKLPIYNFNLSDDIFVGTAGSKKIVYLSLTNTAARELGTLEAYLGHGYANNTVGLGWCGGLQNNTSIGSLVVPEQVVPGEGVTPYLFPEDENEIPIRLKQGYVSKPSTRLFEKLVSQLKKDNHEPLVGKTYSTECLACEGQNVINRLHDNGFLGIDMESSALLATAEKHGKDAVVALIVSDNPYKKFHEYILPLDEITPKFYETEKHLVMEVTSFLRKV